MFVYVGGGCWGEAQGPLRLLASSLSVIYICCGVFLASHCVGVTRSVSVLKYLEMSVWSLCFLLSLYSAVGVCCVGVCVCVCVFV